MNLTKEGISVRTCNHKDVDALVALGIKTFRDTFDEYNSPRNMMLYINETFTRKIIEHEMGQPGTVFFLAFDGQTPGYRVVDAAEIHIGAIVRAAMQDVS